MSFSRETMKSIKNDYVDIPGMGSETFFSGLLFLTMPSFVGFDAVNLGGGGGGILFGEGGGGIPLGGGNVGIVSRIPGPNFFGGSIPEILPPPLSTSGLPGFKT